MKEGADKWELLSTLTRTACRRLRVVGQACLVLDSPAPAPGRPWVFYAPTFEAAYPAERQAWIFSRILGAGIAVTGIDVGESYGNPRGRTLFDAWHAHATRELGFAPKACLVAQSRGGLMLYNWAAEHPQKVSGITGIYTACDLRSYPGLETACTAYELSAPELAGRLADHNPVDRIAPLARAGVPVWHLHGDRDELVPLGLNAGELVRRYTSLGGPAELVVVPGYGHEEHAVYFERQEVVDAITRQALAGAARWRVAGS
jgi:pimeloyl-ACP methyl ester carboxylesterase